MIYLSAADIKASNDRRRGLRAVPPPAPALIPPMPELRMALERKRARAAAARARSGPRVLVAGAHSDSVSMAALSPAMQRFARLLAEHRMAGCHDAECTGCQ